MEKITRAILCAIIALGAARAHADSNTEQAKVHFKNGTDLYDENNFRGALVEFQRAYELAPSYRILFNIGQVEMELQDYAGAIKAFTRYLREGGADIAADRASQVKADIEKLRGRIGVVTIETAKGAEVSIDGVAVGFAPLPEPVTVNTGRHEITVRVTGREPAKRVVDVAGQQQLTVVLGTDLAPPAPRSDAAPAVTEPTAPPSKAPMIVAWSIAGGSAITAGIFALTARSDADKLVELRNTFPTSREALDAQASRERRNALLADSFAVATVVAAGVGVYLTFKYRGASREHAQSARNRSRADRALTAIFTPSGLAVAGSF